jgi:hypothetical protein
MTSDTSIHRHAWDQIPWVVNGSLPDSERSAVESHLRSCSDCREELEFQRHLAGAIAASNPPASTVDDPRRSWQQLRARITSETGRERAPRRVPARAWVPWLVAAVVVQAIGLGVLGTVVWSRPDTALTSSNTVYRTLSAKEAAPAAATIRAVFAQDMSVGHMQALLAAAGLQVRSGPSSAGVWSLEPASDSNRSATQAALKQLRSSADVRFAEAIGVSP